MFEAGCCYSRKQIHDEVGGSIQSYLPTANGKVVCVCVTKELNPGTPFLILVGNGIIRISSARLFASQVTPVPVFIKRVINKWEYIGNFRVDRVSTDQKEIHRLGQEAGWESDPFMVLHLVAEKEIV